MTEKKGINGFPTGPARERVLDLLKVRPGITIQFIDLYVDVSSFEDSERLPAVLSDLLAEGLIRTEQGEKQLRYFLVDAG